MIYQFMFYGGMVCAVVALIFGIILYIKLNITQVIEDLTGFRFGKERNLRKKSVRQKENREKKLTSEIKAKKAQTPVANKATVSRAQVTELVGTVATTPMENGAFVEPTTLLQQTDVEETTLLVEDTTLLIENIEETTLLTEDNTSRYINPVFKKEVDIIVVHSAIII